VIVKATIIHEQLACQLLHVIILRAAYMIFRA